MNGVNQFKDAQLSVSFALRSTQIAEKRDNNDKNNLRFNSFPSSSAQNRRCHLFAKTTNSISQSARTFFAFRFFVFRLLHSDTLRRTVDLEKAHNRWRAYFAAHCYPYWRKKYLSLKFLPRNLNLWSKSIGL